MRHKLLVLTVKNFLQSVYIYGSYRKIKTGVPFFLDHPVHSLHLTVHCDCLTRSSNIHASFHVLFITTIRLLWWWI